MVLFKKNYKTIRYILYLTLLLKSGLSLSAEPLLVYTVNYPLQYFAERIAGEQARVVFPAPAGVDPAVWQPAINEIRQYQQADLVLLNGAGYAQWVRQVSLPRARLLNTSTAFSDTLIEIADTVTHSHGPGGEHMHSGYAVVTWLDPLQAVLQATAIRDALIRLRPDASEALKQNFQSLQKELLELDTKLKDVAGKLQSVPILAAHPVYQYLERRYELDMHTLYWEADRYPAPVARDLLAALIGREQPTTMLWETAPLPATQKQLEMQGIRSVVFATAANRPDNGDYFTVMQGNLKRLGAAIH